MNLFRIKFLCRHEITKIIIIDNYANEMRVIL